MTREIKFRAWDTRENRMLSAIDLENENRAIGSNGLIVGYDADGFRAKAVWKCDWILPMQYTGLLDKNGKEIYEGDILVMDDAEFGAPSPRVKVRFEDGAFQTSWNKSDIEQFCEVIGNCYENPELLAPIKE